MHARLTVLIALFAISCAATAAEPVLAPRQVAPGVYAIVGDIGGPSYENEGRNNNLGFVVTDAGVLVIGTGPTARIARALHAAIGKITDKPVKWVVNGGSQNHYWHGNGYFKAIGARIIASREADRVMRDMGAQQLENNKNLLKEKAAGTTLTYPDELVTDKGEMKPGGTTVQLLHFGAAHTPGDMVVWLPKQGVVFAGDIVYTERMLAVIPIGNTGSWVQAFDKVMALKPKVIVPGHGHPTTVERARRDTRDYLVFIRTQTKKILDVGGSIQDAVEKVDQTRYKYLANFDLLARRNVNQVYLELEKEAF